MDQSLDFEIERHFVPTDGLFGKSWHLRNTGQTGGRAGIDINVTPVWDDYAGRGVGVGVYDDGVDYRHAELDGNYDAALEMTNTAGKVVSGLPNNWSAESAGGDTHGTAVAGLIAAENNGGGAVGVAFGATLTSVPILRSSLAPELITAMNAMTRFDVANHSWGLTGAFTDNFNSGSSYWDAFEAGLEKAAAQGRDGLGTIIVKSAGNSRSSGYDTNHSNFSNDRHVITVAALDHNGKVTSYSTPGAALFVSAPGHALQTTDLAGANGDSTGDYRLFAGTSAAAPVVSGVAALMLEANPELGWRDVQEILAYTARHTGSAIGAGTSGSEKYLWAFNGAKNSNGGGLHFSNDYGFGLVDALAAVRVAETWATTSHSANERSATASVAPKAALADLGKVTQVLTLADDLRIDHVELLVNISHANRGDLHITLTSPSGRVSTILNRSLGGSDSGDNLVFKLSSNAFWGETSGGAWTVTVSDKKAGVAGTVNSLTLKVYGDAVTADDVYIYTNEFAKFGGSDGRNLLTDGGGLDVLNAAAVTGASTIDLRPGATSSLAGQALTIAPTTVIEIAHGGDGGDTIAGNDAANELYGWRGDDKLIGGKGDDRLDGGAGSDTAVYAGPLSRYLVTSDGAGGWHVEDTTGEEGRDRVTGVEWLQFADGAVDPETGAEKGASDTPPEPVTGTDGADELVGDDGDDELIGMDGGDTLRGGAGADTMTGGAGSDKYYVDDAGDAVIEKSGEGTDTVYSRLPTYTLPAYVELLYLDGSAAIEGIGNGSANKLYGNDLDNRLVGGAGNDLLSGRGGGDAMIGGTGNDTYYVDNVGDAVVEQTKQGIDTVNSSIAYELPLFVEKLILTGSSSIDGAGNAHDNMLTGNSGANVLKGGDGDDKLYGNAGNDRLEGGDGDDFLQSGSGQDTLVGGAGADMFDWNETSHVGKGATRDVILDFVRGEDRIDLSGIDASAGASGNQAFTFIGGTAFGGAAGELRFELADGGHMLVQGDVNGDKVADFELRLNGQLGELQATDFVL